MTAERGPERRISIADIRARDLDLGTSGDDLIVSGEEAERNLQSAFVDVLAKSGLPFQIAFRLADTAWEIHKTQNVIRSLPENSGEYKKTEETLKEKVAVQWEELKSMAQDTGLLLSREQAYEGLRQGIHYSLEAVTVGHLLPRIQVVEPENS